MSRGEVRVRADAELRERIARLIHREAAGGSAHGGQDLTRELTQEQADTALARIVCSRLVEPGDAVAGALIAALGPGPLLDLLLSGARAERVCAAARAETGAAVNERQVAAGLKRWLPRLDRSASLADIDSAIAAGMSIVSPETPAWPGGLNDLGDHAPVLLWVKGDASLLSAFSLAVVGARACTGYGTHTTAEFSDAACAAGAAIVSGAAYGIDAVAHRTALAADAPTVAVLAGGADRPYPSSHGPLLDRIVATGAVCSEMVPGSAPTRWRFLQRNRLISALARATLVTEAGTRSGSLNTAGHAAELGRALGAVPGPVTSAASAGCHRLIREYGAMLVTSGAEVRELLGVSDGILLADAGPDDPSEVRESALHRRVIDALPLRGGRAAGDVARLSGLGFDEARGVLAELELLRRITRRETPGAAEPLWVLQRRE